MPDATNTIPTLAADGLAVIGSTRYQLRGIRLVEGEQGAAPADSGAGDNAEGAHAAGEDEEQLGTAGKSALAKERATAKAAIARATAAEAERDALKQAGMTEAQKVQDERDRLKTENANLQLEVLRRDVAAEKKLTPAQAKFLTGATREELAAAADDLIASFPALDEQQQRFGDISQGYRGGVAPSKGSLFAEVLKQASGR
jgi:hypothetical protein